MNELTSEFSSTLPPLETWRTPIGVPRAVHPQEEIRRRLRAQGLPPPGRMALHCYLADHGWSVEAWSPALMQKEQDDLGAFLAGHSPLMQQAARQQVPVAIVDVGMASPLPASPWLLTRKVAHGSRSVRLTQALSTEQVQSAMSIGEQHATTAPEEALILCSRGAGDSGIWALWLERCWGMPLAETLHHSLPSEPGLHALATSLLQVASRRHRGCRDLLELLAALGGLELAALVGAVGGAIHAGKVLILDGVGPLLAWHLVKGLWPDAATGHSAVFAANSHQQGPADLLTAQLDLPCLASFHLEHEPGTAGLLMWPWFQSL